VFACHCWIIVALTRGQIQIGFGKVTAKILFEILLIAIPEICWEVTMSARVAVTAGFLLFFDFSIDKDFTG